MTATPGAGWKDFSAGAVLPSAELDAYLMAQSVMRFATTTARDAALTGSTAPVEGMQCYVDALDIRYYYNGSAWVFKEGWGTGAPEGVVTATKGAIWHRTDGGTGTTLYMKESDTTNTGWVALGAAPSTGPALIRTVIGPDLLTTNTAQVANRLKTTRVRKGGTITSIGFGVQTQSGNTCVAVLRGAVGRAGPTSRVVTSGSVAAPAAGYATVAVASTAVVEETDWLGIASDNATINLYTGGFAGAMGNNFALGYFAYQDTAFPIPASPSTAPEFALYPILIGVP